MTEKIEDFTAYNRIERGVARYMAMGYSDTEIMREVVEIMSLSRKNRGEKY